MRRIFDTVLSKLVQLSDEVLDMDLDNEEKAQEKLDQICVEINEFKIDVERMYRESPTEEKKESCLNMLRDLDAIERKLENFFLDEPKLEHE